MVTAQTFGISKFTLRVTKRIAFVTAITFAVYCFGAFSQTSECLESLLIRRWFASRGPRTVPSSVSVIRVDTRSYRRLGLCLNGPLPAEVLATAIEKARDAGARLIVLDYLLEREWKDEADNVRLVKALAESPVVIGRALQPFIDTGMDGKRRISVERISPQESFAKSAKGTVPLMVRIGDNVVSRISLSDDDSLQSLERAPLLKPLRQFVSAAIREPGDYDLINFYGEPYGIADVPIYEVASNGEVVPREIFKDRVVFIGGVDLPGSNEGKDDSFSISGSDHVMWGVEILATITANLLDGSMIRRLAPATEDRIAVCFFIFFGLFVVSLGLYWGVIVVAGTTVLWLAVSYYSFAHWLLFLPGVSTFGISLPLLLVGMLLRAGAGLQRVVRSVDATDGGRRVS